MSTFFITNKLREYRENKRWTQADLAEAIDVTELTIRRWERGQVIPSAYHMKKLCTVFQTTPEELGLVKSAKSKNEEQILKKPLEAIVSTQQAKSTNKVIEMQEDYSPAQYISAPTILDRPGAETSNEPQIIPSPPKSTLRQYEARHVEMLSSLRKRWFKPVFVISLSSFLFASSLLVALLAMHIHNVQSKNSIHASPAVGQAVLYRADWSKDFDQWSGFPLWQWSQQQGGMLKTTSTIPNNILLAPYHPSTSSYVVEAQIQRIAYSGIEGQGQAFGIVVHLTNTIGYICGVGSHFEPEHFFVGQITPTTASVPYFTIADRQTAVAHLNARWHIYRVIVTNHYVSCLIDGNPIFSIITTGNEPVGNVGVYVDTTAITIKSFVIMR